MNYNARYAEPESVSPAMRSLPQRLVWKTYLYVNNNMMMFCFRKFSSQEKNI